MAIHCPKCNQEREFPPKTSFIYSIMYSIVTSGPFGEMLKPLPLFRRCEGCGLKFTDALATLQRQGGGE
ncbi:MAG: hypothetical protein M5R38_18250 [Candidatus Methylomirabilis sp.]|nr:hypothetical protein [Candidatus Methylomirabilis sp.]